MARYLMLAFSNPIAGREQEYNDWYENVALPTYRKVPGMAHIGRFMLADTPKNFPFEMNSKWKYVSAYTFETDDFSKFRECSVQAIAASESYYFSDDIDKDCFFEPIFVSCDDI